MESGMQPFEARGDAGGSVEGVGRTGPSGRVVRAATLVLAAATAVAAAGAPLATAQQAGDAAARFEQAKLAEQAERDFARAAALYQALAQDAKLPAEQRGAAFVAAARNLERLGQAQEARAALQAAIALGGDAGEEAKRIAAGGFDDARVLERVERAVEQLLPYAHAGGMASIENTPLSDLYWIGEPALPALARLVDEAPQQTKLMACVGYLTVAIGGEQAAALVRRVAASRDVVLRKTWVEAATENRSREPVRSALLDFTRDPDPRVRDIALERFLKLMTVAEVMPYVEVEQESLRAKALEHWIACERSADGALTRGASSELVRALRGRFDDPSRVVSKAFERAFADGFALGTAAGRELYYDALAHDALHAEELDNDWCDAIARAEDARFLPAPGAGRLLELARAIHDGSPVASRNQQRRAQAFEKLIRRCLESREDWFSGKSEPLAREPWPAADHATIVEIGRVAGPGVIGLWIERFATPADLPVLCEMLVERKWPVQGSILKLLERCREIDEAAQERVAVVLASGLGRAVEEASSARTLDLGESLVRVGTRAGDQALLAQVREHPGLSATASTWFLNTGTLGARTDATLLELLTLPDRELRLEGTLISSARGAAMNRRWLVLELARRQVPELPARLAQAFRLGIEDVRSYRSNPQMPALVSLFLEEGEDDVRSNRRWEPRYDVEALEQAILDGAETGAMAFWSGLAEVCDSFPSSAGADAVQSRIAAAVARVLPVAVERLDDLELLRDVIGRFVQKCPGGSEFAVVAFDDARLRDTVLGALRALPVELLPKLRAVEATLGESADRVPRLLGASEDPQVREELFRWLGHPRLNARLNAIDEIARTFPARLVEAVAPLAADPSEAVRRKVASALGVSYDRGALPTLIALLRDPDPKTREGARASLDQLQYYFDTKERWERLLRGAGLEANSAAEALIEQARSGATRDVRLAAIASLGTLKVPETLPFLVQLLTDPDPAIATAAQTAITKIND